MRTRIALVFLLLPALAACETERADVEFLTSPGALGETYPFSEAVRVDNLLFLSGQIGTLPGTSTLIEGGVEAEARQTLENIRAALERHGSGMDQIVKCSVYLVDIGEWPRLNEVYKTFFTGAFPARAALAGSGLALGARVEIDCIAYVDD